MNDNISYHAYKPETIRQAADAYLSAVSSGRSANTARAYACGLQQFLFTLEDNGVDPDNPISALDEDALAWLISDLSSQAVATERLRIAAVRGFYEFLDAERLATINLSRVKLLVRQRGRRPGRHLIQFPRAEIERVCKYVEGLAAMPCDDKILRLRNLRDRALALTLADTGLRVSETCALRRGMIDWDDHTAMITGKGDKQAVVRFSERSLCAIRDYLAAREDGGARIALANLPVFTGHGHANRPGQPISTTTARRSIERLVTLAIGETDAVITPHKFRHYFVTLILLSTGNLKIAQEMARHSSVAMTERYAHLAADQLDRAYHGVFDA